VKGGVRESESPRELSFSESATNMEIQRSSVGVPVNDKAQCVGVAVGFHQKTCWVFGLSGNGQWSG
tara:strand:+ start:254 stop:451 length:198 start_codon:yes stop_codon:yes gene_type:complete